MMRSISALALSAALAAPAAGAPAPVGPSRLGTYVAGGLGLYAPIDVWRADLARARELGIGTIRFNADAWDLIEPSPGSYRWGALDEKVRAARDAGLEILYTLPLSSRWNGPDKGARVGGFDIGPSHFPPRELSAVEALAKALAARYKGQIRYYEAWNEPDFFLFWKGKPDPAEYLAYLRAVRKGIRAADPGAVIVMGGLAKPADPAWFDAFLALGGGREIDVVNMHVYPAFASLEGALAMVRGAMRRHGGQKPIWITETSSTGFYFDTADRAREEALKARYLLKTYAVALSQPDVERVFWHSLRNPGKDVGLARELDFGLMTGAGEKLPAYAAHKTLSRLLGGAAPEGPIDPGGGLRAYRFLRGDRTVLAVWGESPKAAYRVPSSASRPVRVSLDGSERPVEPGESLLAGEEPFFIEFSASRSARGKQR